MTPLDNIPELPRTQTVVAASAAIQLSALLCTCDSVKPPKFEIPRALADRANRFWNDGYSSLAEVVILADATDAVRMADIEPFFTRLLEPVTLPAALPLETESPEERELVLRRLERLASDKRLRQRFVALLRDLWAVVAADWDRDGCARAEAAAEAWSARLAAGADPFEFLPDTHIARREPFAALTADAHRQGRLLISPLAGGYGHIVALPRWLTIATPATAVDPVVARRQSASEIASRLRPLSDPTRLTILAQLAHNPLGVSELATALHIAQPTASVHLRQLREAGLVNLTRHGTKTVYSARPAAARNLLTDAADRLARSMGEHDNAR